VAKTEVLLRCTDSEDLVRSVVHDIFCMGVLFASLLSAV
jgi:hypothetical protein